MHFLVFSSSFSVCIIDDNADGDDGADDTNADDNAGGGVSSSGIFSSNFLLFSGKKGEKIGIN